MQNWIFYHTIYFKRMHERIWCNFIHVCEYTCDKPLKITFFLSDYCVYCVWFWLNNMGFSLLKCMSVYVNQVYVLPNIWLFFLNMPDFSSKKKPMNFTICMYLRKRHSQFSTRVFSQKKRSRQFLKRIFHFVMFLYTKCMYNIYVCVFIYDKSMCYCFGLDFIPYVSESRINMINSYNTKSVLKKYWQKCFTYIYIVTFSFNIFLSLIIEFFVWIEWI